ncbi:MAG: 4Fe-4S binding protein [Methanobacteriaceae archaeon]|mgnify:CR=1 FL=1|nr:4Fe-4S binding protein [Methanobacteriaceae archaeon]
MKNLLKIFLEGAYGNLKKILFASDRVTDMEMRNAILTGQVKPTEKVSRACIGCGGCANVCPTDAITMKPLKEPHKLAEGWTVTEVPELNQEKCVVCYWCHDFCPIYALYEEAGAIHPNDVGDNVLDVENLIKEPFKIPEDKIAFIAQYMSDKSLFDNIKANTPKKEDKEGIK